MSEDFVVWDNAYSVGFDPIDEQHKQLVTMINHLFDSCKEGVLAADAAFFDSIKNAIDYARNHFSDEVKYMSQINYPNLNEHRKQHDDFVTAIMNSMHEFRTGKTAPIDFARFLKDWLLNHIAKTDKQYMPYLEKLKNL